MIGSYSIFGSCGVPVKMPSLCGNRTSLTVLHKSDANGREIEGAWSQAMSITMNNVGRDTDFFSTGVISLNVVSLISRLRKLYGINTSHANGIRGAEKTISIRRSLETMASWCRYSNNLKLANESLVDPYIITEGNVLLMDVTRFVGACFLLQLLRINIVRSVKCFIQARSYKEGFDQIKGSIAKYRLDKQLSPFISNIEVVVGGLSHPFTENYIKGPLFVFVLEKQYWYPSW